jgi:16S rRNA (adenine1518-N6/adenine1519-N6)-dimethyltransferase
MAKKSLGQNFLKSKSIAREIAQAAEPQQEDVVLEIGPGKGALTDALLPNIHTLLAVEKDQELIPFLEEKYKNEILQRKMVILEEDILNIHPKEHPSLNNTPYKIIANIPYYITGAILKKFLTTQHKPEVMVLMVQKEVAQRIVARSGSESILSLSVKAFGVPTIVRSVPARFFSPKPKVDSAVLKINNISNKFFTSNRIDEKKFFMLIKSGFSHKRKKLKNNLSLDFPKETVSLTLTSLDLIQKRAEQLSLQDWKEVYKKICS